MRNYSLRLAMAAAVLALPAASNAQITIGSHTIGSRSDVSRSGVSRIEARNVPPGQRPPRGMCRVWIDGVAPGRQPRPTDCTSAERDAYRYGSRASVIYGDDTAFPGRGRTTTTSNGSVYGNGGVYGSSRDRVYNTTVNGRLCQVHEWYDGYQLRREVTRCDANRDGRIDGRDDNGGYSNGGSVYRRGTTNGGVYDGGVYRGNDRVYRDRDDDDDDDDRDRREIYRDRQEMRRDRRELERDKQELKRDRKEHKEHGRGRGHD